MRNLVIPAILVKNEKEFRERLRTIEGLVDIVQIDVMDGLFVSNTTWCDFAVLRQLDTPIHFELHLMVNDPAQYIEASKDFSAIKRIIWHIETSAHHAKLIKQCHKQAREAGLAINPNTPIEKLAPYVESLDEILIMGVAPGWSAQQLIPSTIEKIKQIRSFWPNIPLGFDGGVDHHTLPLLKEAGITRMYAASSIFKADYPRIALTQLEQI